MTFSSRQPLSRNSSSGHSKFAAVGLEMDAAVFWEDVVVDLEKTMVGEPTLGVAVFRPGIGEMQIDLADLARREDLVEMLGVQPEKTYLLWRACFSAWSSMALSHSAQRKLASLCR